MSGSAKLIAMMGNKGGTGKTTLAVNIAAGLRQEAPTALLDLDPQGSSWQWSRIAEEAEHAAHVYQCHGDVSDAVADLQNRYRYVVLDCPPSVLAEETRSALRLSDYALVPVQPSPMDLWATLSVVEAVAAARRDDASVLAHIVLNQLEPQTVLSRDIREVIDEVGLSVLRCDVRRRAIYRKAMAEGKTVFDMGASGRDAAAEIERLLNEVIES